MLRQKGWGGGGGGGWKGTPQNPPSWGGGGGGGGGGGRANPLEPPLPTGLVDVAYFPVDAGLQSSMLYTAQIEIHA